LVVPVDVRAAVGLQLPDRGMNALPEPLFGELCKSALDLIDPWHRSQREVPVIMRPAGEPRLDLGCVPQSADKYYYRTSEGFVLCDNLNVIFRSYFFQYV
jgi:hypothetical protein